MSDVIDVIEAFADGESVDPARLKEALADEAARDHLIDVLVLRGMVGGLTVARPSGVVAFSGAPAPVAKLNWARWLPAAAAVALIGGITGYLAGSRAPMVPATDPTATSVSSAPAPAPTQVIHLREGVDWTEKAGGN